MHVDVLCTVELWSKSGFNPGLPLTGYMATLGLSKLGTIFIFRLLQGLEIMHSEVVSKY